MAAQADPSDPKERIKATFNLPADALAFLQERARIESLSVTDVLRRAIESERLLSEAEAKGEKILIESADHRMREIVRLKR